MLGVYWLLMVGLMVCINWGDNNYKENKKKCKFKWKVCF